jgi:hypothetical protein
MRAKLATGFEQLPPALVPGVDTACDRFEQAWQAGPAPVLEAYLADLPEPARLVLLRELILIEVAYRHRRHETPRPEDYQQRFPTLEAAWLAQAVAAGLPLVKLLIVMAFWLDLGGPDTGAAPAGPATAEAAGELRGADGTAAPGGGAGNVHAAGERGWDRDGPEPDRPGGEETSGAVPATGGRHRARDADGAPQRTCAEALAVRTAERLTDT